MGDQADLHRQQMERLEQVLGFWEDQYLHRPPRAIIEAVAASGFTSAIDIAVSQLEHDRGTEITEWECTLATDQHLIDVTARAKRDRGIWNGNITERPIRYIGEPSVTVKVSSLDEVRSLELKITGSSESAEFGEHPRQEWVFSFVSGEPRTYIVDSRAGGPRNAAVLALCQRLSRSI